MVCLALIRIVFTGLEGEAGVDCGGGTPQDTEDEPGEEGHDEVPTG